MTVKSSLYLINKKLTNGTETRKNIKNKKNWTKEFLVIQSEKKNK